LHHPAHILVHPLDQLPAPLRSLADRDELAAARGVDQGRSQPQRFVGVVVVDLTDDLLRLIEAIADIRKDPAQLTSAGGLPGEHVVLLDQRRVHLGKRTLEGRGAGPGPGGRQRLGDLREHLNDVEQRCFRIGSDLCAVD
jgi:hypothetical protein